MPLKSTSAAALIPERPTLPKLRQAVQHCRGCDLYRYATQAVFGEGPPHTDLVFIGEEPGNEEDIQGHPFVGPAGKLLDRAFADAGIDRSDVYLTNVIKHFKFEERGKRRIHKKPRASEIAACHPWLDTELLIDQTENRRLPGRHRGSGPVGRGLSINKEPREILRAPASAMGNRYGSPCFHPPRARRPAAPRSVSRVCR